jgi:hypothetical protein
MTWLHAAAPTHSQTMKLIYRSVCLSVYLSVCRVRHRLPAQLAGSGTEGAPGREHSAGSSTAGMGTNACVLPLGRRSAPLQCALAVAQSLTRVRRGRLPGRASPSVLSNQRLDP